MDPSQQIFDECLMSQPDPDYRAFFAEEQQLEQQRQQQQNSGPMTLTERQMLQEQIKAQSRTTKVVLMLYQQLLERVTAMQPVLTTMTTQIQQIASYTYDEQVKRVAKRDRDRARRSEVFISNKKTRPSGSL